MLTEVDKVYLVDRIVKLENRVNELAKVVLRLVKLLDRDTQRP